MSEPGGPGNRSPKGRFVKGVSGNPSGLPKGQANQADPLDVAIPLVTRVDSSEPEIVRLDGWQSALSGIGMASRDKRLSHTFRSDRISYRDAIEMWRGDDLAARAIEAVPAECFREGFEVVINDERDYEDLKEELETAIETLKIVDAVETAFKYERAYGGGALLLGVNDGAELSEPLKFDNIISLDWVSALEPVELFPLRYYSDPKKPKYGQVEHYQLASMGGGHGGITRTMPTDATVIHESRLIIFPGIKVSKFQASTSEVGVCWGDSSLTRFAGVLRDFNIAWASAGIVVVDFSQSVFSMEGLAKMVAQNRTDVLSARLAGIEMGRSTARAVMIDKNETYTRQTTSLAGLPEVLDRLSSRLAAAIDMPLTLLMGQSPKGLGNEGESDIRFFYDRIANIQERKLKPVIRRIVQVLIRSLLKSEPKKWTIAFHPLWQQSDADKASARATQATTDEKYITAGVLTAEEVRTSRFGGEYSYETQVDDELTDEMDPMDPASVEAAGYDPVTGAPIDPNAPIAAPAQAGLAAPQTVDPSKTAMNGAQIKSLLDVIGAVGRKEISRESGVQVLVTAFQMSPQDAEGVLGPKDFEPVAPPTPPGPFGGGGKPGGFPPKGGGGPPKEEEPKAEKPKLEVVKKVDAPDFIEAAIAVLEKKRALVDAQIAEMLAAREDFDPDQPRDEGGRFGSGGGGSKKGGGSGSGGGGSSGGGSAKAPKAEAPKEPKTPKAPEHDNPFADTEAGDRLVEDPKDLAEIERATETATEIAKDWQDKLKEHGVEVVMSGSLTTGLALPSKEHDMDVRFLYDGDRKEMIPTIEKVTGLKMRKMIQVGGGDSGDPVSDAYMIEGFIEKNGVRLEVEGALRTASAYTGWAKHYKEVLSPAELKIARAKKSELASGGSDRKAKEYKAYKQSVMAEVQRRVKARDAGKDAGEGRKDWDPDQPRAENGQFGEGGGGSSKGGGGASKSEGSKWAGGGGGIKDTKSTYSTGGKNPTYKPERVAEVHDKYIKDVTDGVPKSEVPTVYMTGGGPASGKSKGIIQRGDLTGIPTKDKAVYADPDAAKEYIPEFRDNKTGDFPVLGTIVHEESADISQRAVKEALEAGRDVVYDSSGDGGIEKLEAKVAKIRAQGAQRVVASYATVDVDTAILRSDKRAKEEGRYVPHKYLRDVHKDVTTTALAAIERGTYDKLDLWDTSSTGGPVHVATYERETGLKVHDEAQWALFKKRGE